MAKYRCGDHWCTDEELEQLEKLRDGKLKIVDPEEKEGIPAPDLDLSPIHKRFDEMAQSIEGVKPPKIEHGSDEWKAARKRDLDHALFDECSDCTPVRDEVLQSKGKRLADIEPETIEPETEAEVETEEELETSDHPQKGFKYDYDQKIYVKK